MYALNMMEEYPLCNYTTREKIFTHSVLENNITACKLVCSGHIYYAMAQIYAKILTSCPWETDFINYMEWYRHWFQSQRVSHQSLRLMPEARSFIAECVTVLTNYTITTKAPIEAIAHIDTHTHTLAHNNQKKSLSTFLEKYDQPEAAIHANSLSPYAYEEKLMHLRQSYDVIRIVLSIDKIYGRML